MSDVKIYLNKILEEAQRIGIIAEAHLNPGLSSARVVEIANDLPFSLPSDIAAFYQWRNGMRLEGQPYEFRLLPRMVFEPLQDAVHRTKDLLSVVGDPLVQWSRTWYGVCTDLAGDYLAVEADGSRSEFGTIIAITMAREPYPAFRSFKSMLLSIADCYKMGAFFLDDDGFLVEDHSLSDVIYRAHNEGLSPILATNPEDLRMGARRARQLFARENRTDLLEKLADLERRSRLA